MRKFGTRLATVTALVLGASSAANAAEVQRYTFSGGSTYVVFSGSATITCSDGVTPGMVATSGSLSGSEQITVMTDSPTYMSNGITIQLNSFFNTCTGVYAGYSTAAIPYGFTPPDNKMESSTFAGSAQVQPFGSSVLIPITFDIDVVGSGPTSLGKSTSKSSVKGTKSGPLNITTNHSNNQNREGAPEGTMVLDGASLSLDFYYANMTANGTSQLSINK